MWLLGYGPRTAKERLRVAEALVRLPEIREALGSAVLTWTAVRELSRVATAATDAEWLKAARGKTVRQVEEMVSGRKPGDRPDDPAEPVTRHVLRLEISGDTLAAFREARRRIELEVGHSLDDDAAIRMLAHSALRGPEDPGRAPYQVAVCLSCLCFSSSKISTSVVAGRRCGQPTVPSSQPIRIGFLAR